MQTIPPKKRVKEEVERKKKRFHLRARIENYIDFRSLTQIQFRVDVLGWNSSHRAQIGSRHRI